MQRLIVLLRPATMNEEELKGASSLHFSPDGRLLAASSGASLEDRGSVSIWDVGTGRLRHRIQFPYQVSDACFTLDGRGLVFSSDRKIIHWDLSAILVDTDGANTNDQHLQEQSQACLCTMTQQGDVSGIVVSPDGQYVVSFVLDGEVWFWDLKTGQVQGKLTLHNMTGK